MLQSQCGGGYLVYLVKTTDYVNFYVTESVWWWIPSVSCTDYRLCEYLCYIVRVELDA